MTRSRLSLLMHSLRRCSNSDRHHGWLIAPAHAPAQTQLNQIMTVRTSEMLWCCHVRGPDDVLPAPDYATALRWADLCLEIDRVTARENDDNWPYLSAVPAPWPHSPALHAEYLPKSEAYFAGSASVTKAVGRA